MKKLLFLAIMLFMSGCAAERTDYYVFSFDDYTLCVGYDDVEFMELVFEVDAQGMLEPGEKLEDTEVLFWGSHFADIDIENETDKQADISQGTVTGADLFLDDINASRYMIDDVVLSSSVRENCEMFGGEYIERNGYACIIGKMVDDRKDVIILHGDILKPDQDELSKIEIYVE